MIGFALLGFPFLLLGFVLVMGRVEDPMNEIVDEHQVEQFLDNANRAELNTFVREGTDPAVRRFRRRLRPGRRRRGTQRTGH